MHLIRKEVKVMKRSFVFALILALGSIETSAALVSDWHEPYESYFLYLGEHPSEEETGWHQDVQGITHDGDYWFITQIGVLWKIPVSHDLKSVSTSDPGVSQIRLDNVKPLHDLGYGHFGDLSYYEYGGEGYLVIPVEGGPTPAIAVFLSKNLEYVCHAGLSEQTGAGWCAIDPDGYLYTSSGQVSSCYKYKLRWDLLPNEVKLELQGEIPFLDKFGNPLTLTCMQGGVFSESGHLLYVVSGFYDKHYPNDGMNVFDMQTGRRVAQSTNGYGHFNYEFHPGWSKYEEPEGLTIWDLDNGRAPGITGQIHVLMLDNDELDPWWPDDDDVYIKHYTETIHVDGAYAGDKDGTPDNPFSAVSEANNFAWNGARISIKAGTYPESLTFSKQVQLLAKGGTVIIGTGGRISLSASATINISKSGILKIY
jgi:hypothetical protein